MVILPKYPGGFNRSVVGVLARWRVGWISLLAVAAISWVAASDSVPSNQEYQLKTAYLFHFAELAEWPESAPVNICLLGDSPLRDYLPVLEGWQIDNRVVHVSLGDNIDNCRILFLSDLHVLSKAVSEYARIRHVLLVSDVEDFARRGGMVQFTLRDNKLKLVVNLPAVRDAGLKLSSKLLRMAEIVQ